MITLRIRSLLATTAVAAVLSYGLSGHGLPQMSSHDGMAGAAAGFCLLLVTVLGSVGMPKPDAYVPAVFTDALQSYAYPAPRPPVDGRARASPSILQRFRN